MTDTTRRAAHVFLSIGILVTAGSVFAQDAVQQTVVVTAAAIPVQMGTVTRTLTVITREQIAELPVRSIADLLQLVSSVDVRARGERGMQTDLAIRGAGFGQALVLVDGARLNDAQSGHHNGDIPVPLEAIERIEVLQGAGSSLFGADAFGGTINVITRRTAPPEAAIEAGSFDLLAGRAQTTLGRGAVRQLVSVAADRSTGFMYERQFASANLFARTGVGERAAFTVSHLWKDFGANGFYGVAPSHEWTSQTRLAVDGVLGRAGGWTLDGTLSYRTHADHFVFNVERPALSDNRHRSHGAFGVVKATRQVAGRASVTAGAEAGGDWIRSSNLGDHAIRRVSAFGEWRQAFGPRLHADASLRIDRYERFGLTTSPSAGVGWWPLAAMRIRGSTGRGFRVPTFTERFYSDPANLARPDVGAESSWSSDAGVDVFPGAGWVVQGTVFGRRDRDVIDWLRATPADRWQTYNVHRVDARGLELSARRSFANNAAFAQVSYTLVDLDADTVSALCGAPSCLSKYVLDYARHVVAAAATVPLPGKVRLAPRLAYKHRQRNTLTTDYALLDLRVSRRFGRYDLRLDATNVSDTSYQEIAGIQMPGRAATVTMVVGGR